MRGGLGNDPVVEDDDVVRAHVIGRSKVSATGSSPPPTRRGARDWSIRLSAFDLLFHRHRHAGAMNGRQLAQKVAELRRPLRVLYTSGNTFGAFDSSGRLGEGVLLADQAVPQGRACRMVRLCLDRAIDHMGDPIPLPYSVQEDLERFLKENPPRRNSVLVAVSAALLCRTDRSPRPIGLRRHHGRACETPCENCFRPRSRSSGHRLDRCAVVSSKVRACSDPPALMKACGGSCVSSMNRRFRVRSLKPSCIRQATNGHLRLVCAADQHVGLDQQRVSREHVTERHEVRLGPLAPYRSPRSRRIAFAVSCPSTISINRSNRSTHDIGPAAQTMRSALVTTASLARSIFGKRRLSSLCSHHVVVARRCIQQTGFREQKHAAAKRADQSPGGVSGGAAMRPLARIAASVVQSSCDRRGFRAPGWRRRGRACRWRRPPGSQAASHPHRFAVERQGLPAEADLAASEMHDMVGQRQEVGHAGHGRVHAAFQHQNRELHGGLQTV
jgi:hypothetical protein